MESPISNLQNVQVISIEGNIGSGKSTLLRNLQHYCDGIIETQYNNNIKYYFITEPVDLWNKIRDENNECILEKFYKNPSRYAFAFQMMAYVTRFKRLYTIYKKIIEEAKQNLEVQYIIFTERCLYTDKYVFAKMLHEDKNMETIEYEIYNQWFESFVHWVPIHKILYVKTDPIVCKTRVQMRNRNGENNISQEYLGLCHQYQESMIREMSNLSIHTLDGNQNVFDANNWDNWKENIISFVINKV